MGTLRELPRAVGTYGTQEAGTRTARLQHGCGTAYMCMHMCMCMHMHMHMLTQAQAIAVSVLRPRRQ